MRFQISRPIDNNINMSKKFKWVSRLTLVLVLAFVISVCMLTYLSINSISSLQKVTEKNILEEKNNLYNKVLTTIKSDFETISSAKDEQPYEPGSFNQYLESMAERYPYFMFPFSYDKQGRFLFPNFRNTSDQIIVEQKGRRFDEYFQQGETAELARKDYTEAIRLYKRCLLTSENAFDSAKSLNALGRVSVKRKDSHDAIQYYGNIISDHPEVNDNSGFPFSYYSVNQLLNLWMDSPEDTLVHYVVLWIQRLNDQEIALNQSSEALVDRISEVLNDEAINARFRAHHANSDISEIKDLLIQIRQFRDLPSYLSGIAKTRTLSSINTYQLVPFEIEDHDFLVFKSSTNNQIHGFILDVEKYLELLSAKVLQEDLEYQFTIQIKRFNEDEISGQSGQIFHLDPYFDAYVVNIDLYDSEIISDYLNSRRWTYGIVLALFLLGMLLVITLILRDINREKQMASLKSEFISNVSHELKSPITSINMFAESMLLGRVSNATRKKQYLEMIMKESGRLKRMINNILDFSKIENQQQKYNLTECEMSSLIVSVLEEMDFWVKLKHIKLESDLEKNITALIDHEKIKQVFINLISNAIRYTPESGAIEVILFRNGSSNQIDIKDNGIGIPQGEEDKIFQKFYRVKAEETKGIPGTGLGLAVVKEIVDAHNWKIEVRSKRGKGSIFSLIF